MSEKQIDLVAVETRREAAFEWVFAMCKGETRFKMSIPYQETDTDAILCAALKDSENLAAEVEKLREALEAYFEASDNYMVEQDGFYVQADADLRAALAAVKGEGLDSYVRK